MTALQIAFAKVFELSVSAALVGGIVLLFRCIARRWVSPGWMILLWLIVLVKLVTPLELPGLTGVGNWSDRIAYQQRYSVGWLTETAAGYWESSPWRESRPPAEPRPIAGYERGQEVGMSGFVFDEEAAAARSKAGAVNNVLVAAAFIWLAGCLVGAGAEWRAAWRVRRLVRRALPCRDRTAAELLEQGRQEMEISTPVQLLAGGTVFPFLYGFFRPRIVLPLDYRLLYSEAELGLILRHELQHWRMKDNLLQVAASLIRIPHWFNPLVHSAVNRLRVDLELRCDRQVTHRLKDAEKLAYGHLLLKQAELNLRLAGPRRMGAAVPWLESRSALAVRVRAVAFSIGRTKAGRCLRWATAVLAFIISLVLLPGGSEFSKHIAAASPKPTVYAFWLDESVNPRSMGAINEFVNLMSGLDGEKEGIELLVSQPLQKKRPEQWAYTTGLLLFYENFPMKVSTAAVREEIRRREIGHGRILIFLHLPYYRGRSVGISVAKQSLMDLSTLQQLEEIKLY